ncbi:hypothetical protein, partial [Campylobacter sp. LR196d]
LITNALTALNLQDEKAIKELIINEVNNLNLEVDESKINELIANAINDLNINALKSEVESLNQSLDLK